MSAPAFSDAVRHVLLSAGWSPERAVDTQAARLAHTRRGLALHPAAEAFLRSFGGLRLLGPSGQWLLAWDAEAALDGLSVARLRETEAWLGEPFAVLGVLRAADKRLLMSARGALYSASEHVLVCFGTDLAELLERLCVAGARPARALN